MLNAFLRLDLRLNSCGDSSYIIKISLALSSRYIQYLHSEHIPAAAAGSAAGFFADSLLAGLAVSVSLLIGLLLRLESLSLAGGGDLERRSKRDARGAGSVWSKRERLAVRLSVSSILKKLAEAECGICSSL